MLLPDTTFERHYSIAELSALWQISRESVRKLCLQEKNGVIKLSLGKGRVKVRYAIPESTARRIHSRLLNGG